MRCESLPEKKKGCSFLTAFFGGDVYNDFNFGCAHVKLVLVDILIRMSVIRALQFLIFSILLFSTLGAFKILFLVFTFGEVGNFFFFFFMEKMECAVFPIKIPRKRIFFPPKISKNRSM